MKLPLRRGVILVIAQVRIVPGVHFGVRRNERAVTDFRQVSRGEGKQSASAAASGIESGLYAAFAHVGQAFDVVNPMTCVTQSFRFADHDFCLLEWGMLVCLSVPVGKNRKKIADKTQESGEISLQAQ